MKSEAKQTILILSLLPIGIGAIVCSCLSISGCQRQQQPRQAVCPVGLVECQIKDLKPGEKAYSVCEALVIDSNRNMWLDEHGILYPHAPIKNETKDKPLIKNKPVVSWSYEGDVSRFAKMRRYVLGYIKITRNESGRYYVVLYGKHLFKHKTQISNKHLSVTGFTVGTNGK